MYNYILYYIIKEMLSNHDIDELVVKMGMNYFKGCYNKDTLKKVEPNSSYIINLNSEHNEKNERNRGSHWVALITNDFRRQYNLIVMVRETQSR